MNVDQNAKYGPHYWSRTDEIFRTVGCNHCRFTTTVRRRGNALGQTAKLFGVIAKHLRDSHADQLRVESGN